MPLNRDQQVRNETSRSVADFATSRQQERSSRAHQHEDGSRPGTPVQSAGSKPPTTAWSVSLSGRSNALNTSKIHALDSEPGTRPLGPNLFQHKLTVPDTMQHSRQKTSQLGFQAQRSKALDGQDQFSSRKEDKPNTQPRTSIFDDTSSFDISAFDDSHVEEQRTVVLNPRLPSPKQTEPQQNFNATYTADTYNEDIVYQDHEAQRILGEMGYTDDSWEQDLDDERDARMQLHNNPDTRQAFPSYGSDVAQRHATPNKWSIQPPPQPETPSRAPSAPPIGLKVLAPAPQRKVGFVNTPQMYSDTHDASEIGGEDITRRSSPGLSILRPNSAHAVPRSVAIHQRPPWVQDSAQAWQQRSVPPAATQPARFQSLQEHRNVLRQQQEPKVSAPESDMQESSEDERARTHSKVSQPVIRSTAIEHFSSRKRPFDDLDGLDYTTGELRTKTLAELQKEPYVNDPRAASGEPVRDKHGLELSLPDILSRLGKITAEQQRETFRTMTDEEWAQTGQWFVDAFQVDLKELMDVRVQRREIALKYEDKIRRRQRAVEHQQAGLAKQLAELQEGGNGLLKDRPITAGSRAGTPMRPARD